MAHRHPTNEIILPKMKDNHLEDLLRTFEDRQGRPGTLRLFRQLLQIVLVVLLLLALAWSYGRLKGVGEGSLPDRSEIYSKPDQFKIMRLYTQRIKAKDLPCDVFVFLPKENRFFFIDNIDVLEKTVLLFFEPDADPATWQQLKVGIEEEFDVVSHYEVNAENLFS